MANPFRPYLVARIIEWLSASKEIERAVSALPPREITDLVAARIAHQETVVLLHQWAHSLGVPLMRDSRSLMSPRYSLGQNCFGKDSEGVIALSLRHLLLREDQEPGKRAAEIAQFIEAHPDGAWDRSSATRLPELARAPRSSPSAGTPSAAAAPRATFSREEADSYNRAVEHANAGRFSEAWSEATKLRARRPEDPGIAYLTCRIGLRRTLQKVEAREACATAARVAPDDPEARISLGLALAAVDDTPGALEALVAARDRLQARGDAAAANTWLELGQLARRLTVVSIAEAAAARAGPAGEGLITWATALRRSSTLPPDASKFGVQERDEPRCVALMTRALTATSERRLEEARAAAQESRRDFPDAPGTHVIECAVASAQDDCTGVRAHCGEALQAYEESAIAHFLLGLCDLRQKRGEDAQAAMGRVIELNPDLTSAWKNLATLLEASGRKAERQELGVRYQARFGEPL